VKSAFTSIRHSQLSAWAMFCLETTSPCLMDESNTEFPREIANKGFKGSSLPHLGVYCEISARFAQRPLSSFGVPPSSSHFTTPTTLSSQLIPGVDRNVLVLPPSGDRTGPFRNWALAEAFQHKINHQPWAASPTLSTFVPAPQSLPARNSWDPQP